MRMELDTALTVGDLIDLKINNVLRVNHEYQRGLRWTDVQKRMFLDSIFRNYSIPAFYFHVKKTRAASISNTFYDIVDGQQRVDAICTYAEGAFPLIDPSDTAVTRFPNFVKDVPCPWAGLRFNELSDELRDKLKQTKVVAYKLDTDDENEVRDLFIRLQGGTALTPQDKRDSWPGRFTEFVLRVGGKAQVAKWYGHPLYRELVKGNESRRRQLTAQTFMLFDSVRRERKFPDIKSANIDEFYHQNVGFEESSIEAKRFERICHLLHEALSGKQKLVGHHLLHAVLLCDSLMDEYARGWESRLAPSLHEFERRCREASEAQKGGPPSEFERYWPQYAQWTQTQADLGGTIQRRHVFFASEMVKLLEPVRLDGQRGFSDFQKQVIFFRDHQQCQRCAALGEEHDIQWSDADIHHVWPFTEGGPTTIANGALVHRDCHPRAADDVAEFRARWRPDGRQQTAKEPDGGEAKGPTLPPDGTEVKFEHKGQTFHGFVDGHAIQLTEPTDGSYTTFSAASKAVTGTSRNGWRDWQVRLSSNDSWKFANKWREQVAAGEAAT